VKRCKGGLLRGVLLLSCAREKVSCEQKKECHPARSRRIQYKAHRGVGSSLGINKLKVLF